METGPILRSLLRNKTGAILIALQISFTMTVAINAWVMIEERIDRANRESGMNEVDTFHLQSYGFSQAMKDPEIASAVIESDLRQLRELPGVVNATVVNSLPLSDSTWSTGIRAEDKEGSQSFGVAYYMMDEHGLDALGARLVAGQNFAPQDVVWSGQFNALWPPKALISKATAESLYPDTDPLDAVGRTFVTGGGDSLSIITVIGVLDTLQAPNSSSSNVEMTFVTPQKRANASARYLIRAEPGERDRMMPVVEELLASGNSEGISQYTQGRIIRNLTTMEETRRQSYNLDMGLAKIMSFVMIVLVLITGLGILGLASFSVTRRVKQIGIRRALGARQSDIRRYFMVENLMITATGVLLGAVMTVGFNVWLVNLMNFPKIEWYGVPLGVIVLLALGQLAVLGPAQRACSVSPASATRTV